MFRGVHKADGERIGFEGYIEGKICAYLQSRFHLPDRDTMWRSRKTSTEGMVGEIAEKNELTKININKTQHFTEAQCRYCSLTAGVHTAISAAARNKHRQR